MYVSFKPQGIYSCLEELGKLDAINTKVSSMHIGTAIHVKLINYFFFLMQRMICL